MRETDVDVVALATPPTDNARLFSAPFARDASIETMVASEACPVVTIDAKDAAVAPSEPSALIARADSPPTLAPSDDSMPTARDRSTLSETDVDVVALATPPTDKVRLFSAPFAREASANTEAASEAQGAATQADALGL